MGVTQVDKVIKVENLVKVYTNQFTRKKHTAINGISFSIDKGQVFSLVGGNGSGKTTTIKLILGLLRPTSGNVEILGKLPQDYSKNEKLGYLPESSYYYEYLTVREHLDFFASFFKFSKQQKKEKIEKIVELTGIGKYMDTYVAELSRGNLQRMGIAQSIFHDPEILIYDEPASGIDPVGRYEVRKILKNLQKEGKTIFFSSHFLPEVEEMATHIGIIAEGDLLYTGELEKFAPKGKLEEKFISLLKEKNMKGGK
jgi:ABC-2 type transport system ATP-binding protein